ncbi:hypothetical protein E0Z10_g4756 [Xylaria hypoxylon]|uniref:Arabinogalactan endo-beta-1,4-galactanase n=1 Tax=Xylaria hypoxylon TaxID=37992 RepID=A0A4Z0YI28_9PEZI|nr:hypothetical protein E0Z10_g4756 [Xylaria hypoxylon]
MLFSGLLTLAVLAVAPVRGALTYKGVDWSSVVVEEKAGRSYTSTSGQKKSLESILKESGVNTVRQRIWVNPSDGNYNLAYNLQIAKRAKAAGLGVYLDLHYSDKWADPGQQSIPSGWPTAIDDLSWKLYNYTLDVSNQFAAAGITPSIISIGNEIRGGLLWPTGKYDQLYNIARLLNSAAYGIKDSNLSPKPKIMIHLDNGWDWSVQQWFYSSVLSQGPLAASDFDMMGVSFYPFYGSSATLANLKTSLTNMASTWGKELVVAETNWPTSCSSPAYPFPSDLTSIPFSAAGQNTFMQKLAAVVAGVNNGKGIFYWEPAWVDNQALGSSCSSNTMFATADTYQPNNTRLEPPIITAVARVPETSPFVLGPDTCGFTSGGTTGAEDCSATIYTTCLNYEDMPNAAWCGPHTLCCPLSKAYCATYGFTTEEQPGATFTHVRCAESPGFGELYPYPPELRMTTEGSSAENISSVLTVQPAGNTSSSSPSSASPGAIAGAVAGSVIFAVLAILGISLFIKRRRRQQWEQRIHNGSGAMSAPCPPTEDVRFGGGAPVGRLRPLSTIQEQQTPLNSPAFSGDKQRSAPGTLRPHSYGQNWPLAGPTSPRNPLSSHPVFDLEKRLSKNELLPQPQSNIYMKTDVPIVQAPTPPSFGTLLSPPPPLRKPEPARMLGGSILTNAIGLALQSPRLSYIPPPTIDEAFGEDVRRTLNGVGEPDDDALDKNETNSSTLPLLATDVPWPATIDTTVGMKNKKLSNNGFYINPNREISSSNNDSEPMSPLDVTGQGELDDMVSPMSPDDMGSAEGRLSPMTVSPLESQRGSFGL